MLYPNLYPPQANSPATTLSEEASANATQIQVEDAAILPEAPNLLVIGGPEEDAETVLMTAKNGNTLTVQRGIERAAGEWAAQTAVARRFTASDHAALQAWVTSLKAGLDVIVHRLSTNVTLHNILNNPEFDGTAGWSSMQASAYTMSTSDGKNILTGIAGNSVTAAALIQTARPYVQGHTMYVRAKVKCSVGDQSYIYSQGIQVGASAVVHTTQKTTEYVMLSTVFEITAAHIQNPWFALVSNITPAQDAGGIVYTRTKPLCIDLTEAFGAGNEPDKEWCDANIPFFSGSTEITYI